MTKRIFNSISVVSISAIIAVLAVFMLFFYGYFSAEQMDRLKEETNLVAQGVTLMGQDFLDNVQTHGSRITWIDIDGRVIFDSHSDSAVMANHNEREEIARAIKTGYGESRRYSDTLTEEYFYCAVKIKDGTIIRLSVAQSSLVTMVLNLLRPRAIAILMTIAILLVFATHLSKSIITPLNGLNLDSPMDNASYEELYPLLRRIDSQQKEIRLQTFELQRKKDELDTIVGNMNEGIVLLKANGCVMSINNTAKKILGISGRAENKSFTAICKNSDVTAVLDKVWRGESSETVFSAEDGVYRLNAGPVFSENKVVGIALLFFDITEKEKSEQMRREFTANVSHELKSPLHSIAGYSELIMNQIATGDDVLKFSQRINSEAKRMNGIIQDIITLSQLDEGPVGMDKQPVDILALAHTVVDELKQTAETADVSLKVSGDGALIMGILPLLKSTVHNLCENAIKYNHPGGYVNISVCDSDKSVYVTVEDNGIGIPSRDHENIFRRFYRVDKSRSREKGGSGLGLSIVKHAVKIHGGRITLDSRQDKGTKITVYLPK